MFKRRKKASQNLSSGNHFNYGLAGLTLFLCFFGLLMIYEASAVGALRDFQDKFHYARDQLRWILAGVVIMIFFSNFNYHFLYNLSLPLVLLEIVLLFAVFIPGLGAQSLGASRWLNLRIFSFQPSELAKIILVIYLSAWLSAKEKRRLLAFFLLIGIFGGLIILQPDMGTAMILSITAVFIYFASGAPIWHFVSILIIGFLTVFSLIKIAPYRFNRFLSFLKPGSDPLGISYHINQIMIALGTGGFFGVGLGKSRQKFAYLPEATTDSIFAIIGEELGFLGASVLIISLFMIFFKGYKIAALAGDKFGNLLGIGLTLYLFFQASINLAGMVSLLPLTGVPLPFISYGGSSLVISMMAVGILLNIDKQS